MRKIVVHRDYGAFSLTDEMIDRLREFGESEKYLTHYSDIPRDNANLVKLVESGMNEELSIVEIPDDVNWHIAEYDGAEWVAEDHRIW